MYIITLLISTSIIISALLIIVAIMTGINNNNNTSPFECGFDPFLNAKIPFSMRFFLITIIFLIFDVEIVIIIPLGLSTNSLLTSNLIAPVIFLVTLLCWGLLHEWNQGLLNWLH